MGDVVEKLKTNVALLKALEKASHAKPSTGELLEQRVSFIYGSIGAEGALTREKIKQILVEQGAVQP
jgi:hypothetical protein